MALFDITDAGADQGYCNIREAADSTQGGRIRQVLEALWQRYEPYADGNFAKEFARQPNARFWEMYLTIQLLKSRRQLRPRAELAAAVRDKGPDISVRKATRRIWIEAVSPEQGDIKINLDRVPDLPAAGGKLESARREVELRITGALWTKAQKLRAERDQGIVGENDSCIVAVSAGQFPLQAIESFLGEAHDFVYVHNSVARKPIPRAWIRWFEEYVPVEQGKQLKRRRREWNRSPRLPPP